MDDRVKIRCPACTRVFRENAERVRDGLQVNCQNCNRLLTLSKESEDPFFRRALKTCSQAFSSLTRERIFTSAMPSFALWSG